LGGESRSRETDRYGKERNLKKGESPFKGSLGIGRVGELALHQNLVAPGVGGRASVEKSTRKTKT